VDLCGPGSNSNLAAFSCTTTAPSYQMTAGIDGSPGSWTIGTVGAVPEPESWALMIAGFAGLGLAARRRRVKA